MKNLLSLSALPEKGWQKALLALLVAAYLAGIVGLQLPVSLPLFQALTPFNLLLSAGILFAFHRDWNPQFLLFCILTFGIGFAIEVAGVASGQIFGQYVYGPTLGFQLWNVPVVIGLNWLMLIYSSGIICAPLRLPLWAKAAGASSLMVLLDLLIEPVAVRLHFWSWENAEIPLQNYLAWFAVSYGLHLLFFRLSFQKKNPAAKILYLLQLLFFFILLLFTIY